MDCDVALQGTLKFECDNCSTVGYVKSEDFTKHTLWSKSDKLRVAVHGSENCVIFSHKTLCQKCNAPLCLEVEIEWTGNTETFEDMRGEHCTLLEHNNDNPLQVILQITGKVELKWES